MTKIDSGLIRQSNISNTFNDIHPFLMRAFIDSNVIGLTQPFHCTDQGTEMIRPKIVIQGGSMFPLLFKDKYIPVAVILRKPAVCAAIFLEGLISYELARTQ